MIQGWKSHILVPVYLACALGALLAGCSTKEDPDETLDLCGNHSCGDLIMVTTDTSSDGYQYLEPVLSDDGSTIYFSGDYLALTPNDRPPDQAPMRQIFSIPARQNLQPTRRLAENGAKVLRYTTLSYISQNSPKVADIDILQKGSPQIIDDHTLLIWVELDRGARLVKLDFNSGIPLYTRSDTLYLEPDDYSNFGGYWFHRDPSISPDRKWVAFSRFGWTDRLDSLATYTGQAIWVVSLEPAATGPRPRAFPVTTEVSVIGSPSWAPDGRRIVFHGSVDLSGEAGGRSGTEIYTISFDTTGLAANGGVPLNRDLRRVTYSDVDFGNPLRGVLNTDPVFSSDGSEIIFVSTRRAPSITLYDRNIWRVPADGRLDPQILFFSRADDVDPFVPRGTGGELVFSSAMGFPTEYLNRIQQETYQALLADTTTIYTEPEAALEAQSQRRQLEFFERVMSHLYIFRGWQ